MALTYSGYTQAVVIYVDGKPVTPTGRSAFAPAMVNMSQAWLGRSMYSVNPYLNGGLQDFRFYSGLLR